MNDDLAIAREIYSEFRIASRVARIVYTFPRLCHRLMHRYQEVINLYYKASFRELLRETLPLR